jgi:hypothetical protein
MAKRQSKQEQYIAALETLGYAIVPSRSSKYVCMRKRTAVGPILTAVTGQCFWLGVNGAVRVGETASKSHGKTSAYKQRLLEMAKQYAAESNGEPEID